MDFGNRLLRATANRHFVSNFAGPLSIKTVIRGAVTWIVDGRNHTVRPGEMLVLNSGQPYSMNIDEREPVTTAVVFFGSGFFEQVGAPFDPDCPFASPAVGFHSRVRPLSNALHEAIRSSCFDTIALELARENRLWTRVPAKRPATRDELLARLSRSRDYLHSTVSCRVSLTEAARPACLSDYHFHRLFTRVYGVPPGRYSARLRIERAAAMLVSDNESITDIAMLTGFAKPGALSEAFRRTYGVTPSAYRENGKIREASHTRAAVPFAT